MIQPGGAGGGVIHMTPNEEGGGEMSTIHTNMKKVTFILWQPVQVKFMLTAANCLGNTLPQHRSPRGRGYLANRWKS